MLQENQIEIVAPHGQSKPYLVHECPLCGEEHWYQERNKESILEEASRLVDGSRQASYGHPLDDYTATSGMFNAAFAHKLREDFTAEEMMHVMVIVKASRLARNMTHRDSLVDIAGYARCIEKAGEERSRRANS